MHNRNFNNFLYFNRNFPNHLNVLLHNDLYWLDDLFLDKFFPYHYNLLYMNFFNDNLHNLLYNLWDLYNSLYDLDYRNDLLYYTINGFVNGLDVVAYLEGLAILDHRYHFLDYSLDDFNLGNLHNSLHDLFLYHRHLHDLLDNLFNRNNLFPYNLNLL